MGRGSSIEWQTTIERDGTIRMPAEFVGEFLDDRLRWEAERRRRTPKSPVVEAPRERAIWLGIHRAAELLDESPESLRKKLERASRKGPDGQVEADLNGIRGRMLGRRWKIHIPAGWAAGGAR